MKAYALAAVAVLSAVSLAGCSLVSGQVTPTPAVQSDIQTAFTVICTPACLYAVALFGHHERSSRPGPLQPGSDALRQRRTIE